MRATSKKVFNEYTKEITTILKNNGFKQSDELYNWSKTTKYGLLSVKLDNEPRIGLFTIWQRFENVTKANEILKLMAGNQYSGKCNIHEPSLSGLIYEFNRFLILIS